MFFWLTAQRNKVRRWAINTTQEFVAPKRERAKINRKRSPHTLIKSSWHFFLRTKTYNRRQNCKDTFNVNRVQVWYYKFYGANCSSHHVLSFSTGVNCLSHPIVYDATVQATIIVSSFTGVTCLGHPIFYGANCSLLPISPLISWTSKGRGGRGPKCSIFGLGVSQKMRQDKWSKKLFADKVSQGILTPSRAYFITSLYFSTLLTRAVPFKSQFVTPLMKMQNYLSPSLSSSLPTVWSLVFDGQEPRYCQWAANNKEKQYWHITCKRGGWRYSQVQFLIRFATLSINLSSTETHSRNTEFSRKFK